MEVQALVLNDSYLSNQQELLYYGPKDILQKREGKFIYVKRKLGIEIPFGDYLFHSHRYYLFFYNSGGFYIGTDIVEPSKLTDSFTSFLELYLSDPDKICLWV